MAAFLHVAPGGMRFNNDDLGAWYAAAETVTAIAEVAHHLRREAVASSLATMSRTYRTYLADPAGAYVDLRRREAEMPEIFAADSYAESQRFGETVRATDNAGILYPSVRKAGGLNSVGYRPSLILNVRQGEHFEITVQGADRQINVRTLSVTAGAL
jgi:RES domain-containing protein